MNACGGPSMMADELHYMKRQVDEALWVSQHARKGQPPSCEGEAGSRLWRSEGTSAFEAPESAGEPDHIYLSRSAPPHTFEAPANHPRRRTKALGT